MEEWAKNSENHEIWALTSLKFICWGALNILKTSFGYSFSGLIASKSLDHARDPKGVKKISLFPQKIWGEGSPWRT